MSKVELASKHNLIQYNNNDENINNGTPSQIKHTQLIENSFQNFQIKKYSEVIKNPDCTYIQEDTNKKFYYFCKCSEKAYFPICEACAFTCHINHNPQIRIEGFFVCNCGLKNHNISEKCEKRFEEKSRIPRKCFYSEFYENSYNKGFYKAGNGKSLCSVCFKMRNATLI